jgi:hypothetical protein
MTLAYVSNYSFNFRTADLKLQLSQANSILEYHNKRKELVGDLSRLGIDIAEINVALQDFDRELIILTQVKESLEQEIAKRERELKFINHF